MKAIHLTLTHLLWFDGSKKVALPCEFQNWFSHAFSHRDCSALTITDDTLSELWISEPSWLGYQSPDFHPYKDALPPSPEVKILKRCHYYQLTLLWGTIKKTPCIMARNNPWTSPCMYCIFIFQISMTKWARVVELHWNFCFCLIVKSHPSHRRFMMPGKDALRWVWAQAGWRRSPYQTRSLPCQKR